MSEDSPDDAGPLYRFVEDLKRLRKSCGQPGYGRLAALSAQLGGYGEQYRRLPRLSRTTLSGVFNHRRKRPSGWDLVASIVLSCELHAWETGVPGRHSSGRPDADAVLRPWYARHQALLSGQDAPPGGEPQPPPLPAPLRAAEPDGHRAPAPAMAWIGETYGVPGLALYGRAEDGDQTACLWVALLAHLDDRREEAEPYLAEAQPCTLRQDLLESHFKPGRAGRDTALSWAYDLARHHHEAEGDLHTAALFAYAAARQGDKPAAQRLAAVLQALGHADEALLWTRRAAGARPRSEPRPSPGTPLMTEAPPSPDRPRSR